MALRVVGRRRPDSVWHHPHLPGGALRPRLRRLRRRVRGPVRAVGMGHRWDPTGPLRRLGGPHLRSWSRGHHVRATRKLRHYRGAVPLALFGIKGYGAVLGVIATPVLVVNAASPTVFA